MSVYAWPARRLWFWPQPDRGKHRLAVLLLTALIVLASPFCVAVGLGFLQGIGYGVEPGFVAGNAIIATFVALLLAVFRGLLLGAGYGLLYGAVLAMVGEVIVVRHATQQGVPLLWAELLAVNLTAGITYVLADWLNERFTRVAV